MSPLEPFASLRWPTEISAVAAKRARARLAASEVVATLEAAPERPHRVGLGSGSTAFLTLLALSESRASLPGDLRLVATSYEMEWYAAAAGFALADLDGRGVDVAFDGADQVAASGALVKGRGGAMRRERAVLDSARRELIVVDGSKRVETLAGLPLPLELAPSDIFATVDAVEEVAAAPVQVRSGSGKDGPVIAESGGILADLVVPPDRTITDGYDELVRSVPGVLATGYFAPSAKREVLDG